MSFVDEWRGAGNRTWTIDNSRSTAEFVFVGPIARGAVDIRLTDE